MSAHEIALQLNEMIEEADRATMVLAEVESKLDSIEGSALLLGLMQSNSAGIRSIVELVEAAKHNRETLGQFLFHIKNRINVYRGTIT